MTKKQIAMNAIGKVQNTDCKIPFKFTTESFWNDIKDEIPLELIGFFLTKEFAKYFWPCDPNVTSCGCANAHLQQMVVAEDPILYLKDYL